MALTDINDIKLYSWQEKMLEELSKPQEWNMEYIPGLIEQMAEVQPVSEELEQMGYSVAEMVDSGLIYAPYIPLQVTPTLNVSDLKPKTYVVKNYGQIYSNINERFKLLDL